MIALDDWGPAAAALASRYGFRPADLRGMTPAEVLCYLSDGRPAAAPEFADAGAAFARLNALRLRKQLGFD